MGTAKRAALASGSIHCPPRQRLRTRGGNAASTPPLHALVISDLPGTRPAGPPAASTVPAAAVPVGSTVPVATLGAVPVRSVVPVAALGAVPVRSVVPVAAMGRSPAGFRVRPRRVGFA
ncbi:MAG: hypothetical protein ACRDZN_17440, partial [Acidimicrobiales bacterium]